MKETSSLIITETYEKDRFKKLKIFWSSFRRPTLLASPTPISGI